MMFDAATVAVLITTISFLAQVSVAIINNFHKSRMYKLRIQKQLRLNLQLHERQILEDALSGIGNISVGVSLSDKPGIGKSCLLATAYVDHDTAEALNEVVVELSSFSPEIDQTLIDTARAGITKRLQSLHIEDTFRQHIQSGK